MPNEDTKLLDEDTSTMTFAQLYSTLIQMDEVIVHVPVGEEDRLRSGLTRYKGKQNYKLRQSGLPVENTVLSFNTLPQTAEDKAANISRVQITLGERAGVTVHKIELPDGEL